MKFKKNNGVTLVSLSMYIVVSVIVLASLTFLNVNFMSQVADLSKKSEKTNEILKAEAALISDIKSANRILEYSDRYLRLDNGVQYTIKYRSNEKKGTDQYFDVYELYRGDILITDKMSDISFSYDFTYNEDERKTEEEWVKIKMMDFEMAGGELYVKVGKGY